MLRSIVPHCLVKLVLGSLSLIAAAQSFTQILYKKIVKLLLLNYSSLLRKVDPNCFNLVFS
jgi:hypothetical protein